MAAVAENDCPICQDTLHSTVSVGCTVPCGHLFHRCCFETWQIHSQSRRCPCCNSNLKGFIDKIHITLPNSSSSLTEIKLERRKALSDQKAKRSAMMRHKDRRKQQSMTTMWNVNGGNEIEVHLEKPAAKAKSVSLSASLQRVPSDPVKGAELKQSEKRDCSSSSRDDDMDDELGIRNLFREEAFFAGVVHLDDQIPNVADKIMENIERALQQPTHSLSSTSTQKSSNKTNHKSSNKYYHERVSRKAPTLRG